MSISEEEIGHELRIIKEIPWADFWLTPGNLRESVFLMAWSQRNWGKKRVIDAVNNTRKLYAVTYSPLWCGPSDDLTEFELYCERLTSIDSNNMNRPDLLIFSIKNKSFVDEFISEAGGHEKFPFLSDNQLQPVIQKAVAGIGFDIFPCKAKKMPDYKMDSYLTITSGVKIANSRNPLLPTIRIQENHLTSLLKWKETNKIPIHLWSIYNDRAYGLSLDEIPALMKDGLFYSYEEVHQYLDKENSISSTFKYHYHNTYLLGTAQGNNTQKPAYARRKTGQLINYIKVDDGFLKLTTEAVELLIKR